ncbi:putative LRR receptor-like serine/threonine-protein kinase [Planoprotostelium fungivorum]|uniref:Putative LRR receptor-like serine/threonine-protein kinase n=1 Tax=Planoprotostelium fungivorum TaxID=1890364 RepID=A0A2P6NPN7_9EUKA|nr:putative LRR receptor-like serine/threonine-protein kinase [Planoprotostelium fungivorum]
MIVPEEDRIVQFLSFGHSSSGSHPRLCFIFRSRKTLLSSNEGRFDGTPAVLKKMAAINRRILFLLSFLLVETFATDRDVLYDLYRALGGDDTSYVQSLIIEGPKWRRRDNWDPSLNVTDIDSFYGVNIYSDRIYIDLNHNNLVGRLPDSIGNFSKQVVFINLSYNNISGQLPPTIRNLSSITFHHQPPLTDDLGLETFICGYNNLDGSLPDFSVMQSLLVLLLSNNQFSGPLPPLPSNITVIDFSHNELTGTISDYLSSYLALSDISLSFNFLTGEIRFDPPDDAPCTLTNLSYNQFSGSISNFIHVSRGKICVITDLATLDISHNHLTGHFELDLSQYESFQALTYIDLSYNAIESTIPQELFVYTLQYIDLSHNRLNGSIPGIISYQSIHLRSLFLNDNALSGDIPVSIVSLYQLQYLSLSHNHLTCPDLSILNDLTNLQLLDLSVNDIQSTLNGSISSLVNLYSFNVSHNRIEGVFPAAQVAALQLLSFDVSHNLLMGQVLPFRPTLEILDISSNKFDGSTTWITSLLSIYDLNISHNQFTGNFPTLPRLITLLDVSHNSLSGSLPPLSNSSYPLLNTLYADHNQFTGYVEDLSPLTHLKRIDISNNHLHYAFDVHFNANTSFCDFRANSFECPLSWDIVVLCGANCTTVDFNSSRVILTMALNFDEFSTASFITQFAKDVNISSSRLSIHSVERGSVIMDVTIEPPSQLSVNEPSSYFLISQLYACTSQYFSSCPYPKLAQYNITEVQQYYPPSTTEGLSRGAIAGIVIGAVCFAAIVVSVVVLFVWRRRKNRKSDENSPEVPDILDGIMLANVKMGNIVGAGNFGDVYRGTWNGVEVALKGIREKDNLIKFKEEIRLLHKLNHPNVVRLWGLHDNGSQIFMVLQWAELGSLDQLFRKASWSDRLSNVDLVCMVHDVCKGLMYLQNRHILHRDLAVRNLLVDGMQHISDFGLSKENDTYEATSKTIPYRWSAPEVLKDRRSTMASDLWSFGVVVWEIFSMGRIPYIHLSNLQVIKFVEEGNRLEKPERCPPAIWDIVSSCWENDPTLRTPITQIYEDLLAAYPEISERRSPLLNRNPSVLRTEDSRSNLRGRIARVFSRVPNDAPPAAVNIVTPSGYAHEEATQTNFNGGTYEMVENPTQTKSQPAYVYG